VRTPSEILDESLTIAVVGASRHEEKAAYTVPAQLR
jgi:predicted CoA-binding protein